MIPMERIVIGISGASGTPIAIALLEGMKRCVPEVERHLIISRGGVLTLTSETEISLEQIQALADVVHPSDAVGASIASGSFQTLGMVVVPCSMKTVAGIATGYSDNLLLRAADVTLKERRRLILVARECPLSTIHLRNLLTLSELGAVIVPPVLGYYNHPVTIEDATHHVVGKIMDCLGFPYDQFKRWEGMQC